MELTLTLNRLWRDEQDRRKRLHLNKPTLVMDMRNNMEGSSVDRNQLPSVNLIHTNPILTHEKIKDHLT